MDAVARTTKRRIVMDEYISREAVVRYLKGYSEKELNSSSFGMITSSVLNKAERAISEMPAADVQHVKPDWISVKDRMPKEGVNVLVYGRVYSERNGIDVDYVDENGDFYYYNKNVTHWQYLPEPPEREDDANG